MSLTERLRVQFLFVTVRHGLSMTLTARNTRQETTALRSLEHAVNALRSFQRFRSGVVLRQVEHDKLTALQTQLTREIVELQKKWL